MTGYIYIISLIILLLLSILKEIYLYIKGEYNPYEFTKGEKELPLSIKIINIFIFLYITIGGTLITIYNKLLYEMKVIIICFCFFYILSSSIMNYLSYRKIKDNKIIYQTIIFTLLVIGAGIWIWNMHPIYHN